MSRIAKKKPPLTKRQTAALFAGLIATYFAVVYGGEYLMKPWASPLSGGPTLTGHWQGTAPMPGGDAQIVIELKSRRFSPCVHCPDIEGRMIVCGTGGAIEYDVWGDVEGRSGRHFSLTARVTDGADDSSTAVLTTGDGDWPGGDDLALTGRLTANDERPYEPIQWEMDRSDEDAFEKLC